MRYRHILIIALGAALASIAACASAEPDPVRSAVSSDAGNAAAGLAYAEQVCARCHAVARGATWSPDTAAPAFETLANTPGMTGYALNAWLHTPHQDMPNFVVEPEHVDDLAAYLASLRRRD
ncbi:c-type cytochrome [Terricaulis sp.]|uniref:c-type cytochrome n=1 Tax=Terricaulis sp. TaxID=2768686 RepID=UPI0037849711